MSNGLCECGCGESTPLASRTVRSRGWTKGEPKRFINGHNNRKRPGPWFISEDRGHTTPCWIWQGALSSSGYANKYVHGSVRSAHRISYEEAHGSIAPGLEIDHLCRVRSCVNPDHLEAVTSAENCRRGANTKLTPALVGEIRRLGFAKTQEELGAQFGIAQTTVSGILRKTRWQEIGAS